MVTGGHRAVVAVNSNAPVRRLDVDGRKLAS